MRNLLIDLPDPIKVKIWGYLDISSAANLTKVNRYFYNNYYLREALMQAFLHRKRPHEQAALFRAQSIRLFSLTADFSGVMHLDQPIAVSDYPLLKEQQELSQFLDLGRANSAPQNQLHSMNFFQDFYHRDAKCLNPNIVHLAQLANIVPAEDESHKLIVISPNLLYLVYPYLRIGQPNRPFEAIEGVRGSEKIYYIKAPSSKVLKTLNALGELGALPNRDMQIKFYLTQFNLERLRKYYSLIIEPELDYYPENTFQLDKPISISFGFAEKKEGLIQLLDAKAQSYQEGLREDSRVFYCHVLMKLLAAISDLDQLTNNQDKIQARLTLQRVEDTLKHSLDCSYSVFVCAVESCLDDLLILLSLEHKLKPNTALQTSEIIKQFITEAVGICPQIATLRSSGMQAIMSSVDLVFLYWNRFKKSSATVMISDSAYYEINMVFQKLFRIKDAFLEAELCFTSNMETGACNRHNSSINKIIDLYIGNFESNVLFKKNHIQFSDIMQLSASKLI